MVTKAVKFCDPQGHERDALVLHEFPHCEQSGVSDPRTVNLAIASDDPTSVGGFGRALEIITSVKHRDAQFAAPADGASAPQCGVWYEVGE